MRRRLSLVSLIAACAISTGAPWDMLQVFAWGRMISEHARTMSLAAATAKTFDGEMCGICRAVAKAKRQQRQNADASEAARDGKILLFCSVPPPAILTPPPIPAWRSTDAAEPEALFSAPPVPPPRAAPA